MELTRNEILDLMYRSESANLKTLADYIEKHELDWQESAQLIREIADEQDAQSIVVRLRDDLNKPKT